MYLVCTYSATDCFYLVHLPKILQGEGINELKYIAEKAPRNSSNSCGLGFHQGQIVDKPDMYKDGDKSIIYKCVQNPSRTISIAFLLHFTCSI